MYGFIDTGDQFIHSFKNMFSSSGKVTWFNTLAYEPIHVLGDTTVVWEYCNV